MGQLSRLLRIAAILCGTFGTLHSALIDCSRLSEIKLHKD